MPLSLTDLGAAIEAAKRSWAEFSGREIYAMHDLTLDLLAIRAALSRSQVGPRAAVGYSSPSQYSAVGPGRTNKTSSPAASLARILPVVVADECLLDAPALAVSRFVPVVPVQVEDLHAADSSPASTSLRVRLHPKGTSGATLAGKAVTHGDHKWIARHCQTQLPTVTGGPSGSQCRKRTERAGFARSHAAG
jgi:hypothetical protein